MPVRPEHILASSLLHFYHIANYSMKCLEGSQLQDWSRVHWLQTV